MKYICIEAPCLGESFLVQQRHTAREGACRDEAKDVELALLGGIFNMNNMNIHCINI